MRFSVGGFTLIELLVVITIMALLALVSFAKLATLREDQQLKAAANELQDLIRTAQTNATTNVKCGLAAGIPWAVKFESSTNIKLKCLFLVKKDVNLANNIQIESVSYSNCLPGNYPHRVKFAPLTGQVTFYHATCTGMTVTIKKVGGSGATKSIIVTRGGAIEIR